LLRRRPFKAQHIGLAHHHAGDRLLDRDHAIHAIRRHEIAPIGADGQRIGAAIIRAPQVQDAVERAVEPGLDAGGVGRAGFEQEVVAARRRPAGHHGVVVDLAGALGTRLETAVLDQVDRGRLHGRTQQHKAGHGDGAQDRAWHESFHNSPWIRTYPCGIEARTMPQQPEHSKSLNAMNFPLRKYLLYK
jgi:hypothetical protein